MILTAAFWFSFGLSLLKALEIILSQKQQRTVQDKLEIMALRLSYLDLSSWIAALRETRVQFFLAILTIALSHIAFAAMVAYSGGDVIAVYRQTLTHSWMFLVSQITTTMVVFPIELRWLVRPGKRWLFLKKLGLIFGIYAVLFFGKVVWGWDVFLESFPRVQIFIITPLVAPLSVCIYSMVYLLIIRLLQGLVITFTKIVWRVVEYPKGAWTALLFIATAILGIAQTVFTNKH